MPLKAYHILCSLLEHPEIVDMKGSVQHKNTDTYSHCRHVALRSVWLIRHMKIQADLESVVTGAMLHDFRLQDCREESLSAWQCVKQHPEAALAKAEEIFDLNWKERNIISSHMWPIRIAHLPKCKEAVIVNVADKICAVGERFWCEKLESKLEKEMDYLKEMEKVS